MYPYCYYEIIRIAKNGKGRHGYPVQVGSQKSLLITK